MNFFSTVGNGFTKAIDFVVEKNRKAALINRVKLVISNEEDNAQHAYIALGKYYFRNLRDESNEETEHYCGTIENANKRRDRALLKLDDLTAPQEPYCSCDEDECDECDECDDFCEDSCYDEDLKKMDGIDDEDDDQQELIGTLLHPELLWHEDEVADDAYGKTIPTDKP